MTLHKKIKNNLFEGFSVHELSQLADMALLSISVFFYLFHFLGIKHICCCPICSLLYTDNNNCYRTSFVFSLAANDDSDEEVNQKPTMNVSKSTLQKDTVKDLNLKSYQLSENIRQLKKEIRKMEESVERHSGNKAVLKTIEAKLQSKKSDLQRMQDAEQKVQGEQKNRKDTKKYCVF